MRFACLLSGLFLISISTAASALDWTEFRGPTGQGISTAKGLPLEWSSTKNVVWKQPLEGKGWSSPVLLGERLFLTSAVPQADESQSLHALCLDPATGKVRWDQELFTHPKAKIHTKNSHASPTPITDGKFVFVHFGTYGTACLDLDGKVIWKNSEIKYSPVHGNGGSPVLIDGKLVFSCDGGDNAFVIALDQSTGKLLWKTERPANSANKFAFSTPLIIEVNGEKQIVSAGAGHVAAYKPTDGTEIWHFAYPGGYSVVPRPVFAHGLIYVSSGYNTATLYAVKPDGSGDVTTSHLAWKYDRAVPKNASPIVVGDEIYIVSDNGVASCLDAKSGKEIWQKRVGGDYSASPVFAEDRLYFLSEAGETVILAPGKEFKEIGRNKVEERTLASFGVTDGALFIRTEKHLLRIEQKPAVASAPAASPAK